MSTRRDHTPTPGTGVLAAAGGPALWRRTTADATRGVHDVAASVRAACATLPAVPRVARGPLFGTALAGATDADPEPARPGDGPAGRARGRGAGGPAPAGQAAADAPSHPAGGLVRAATAEHPQGAPRPFAGAPPRAGSAEVSPGLPASRLRTLAGPIDAAPPRASRPRGPGPAGTAAAGPLDPGRRGAVARAATPAASRSAAGVGAPSPTGRAPVPTTMAGRTATEFAPGIAARVARRLGPGSADAVAALVRAAVRPPGVLLGPAATDLLALTTVAGTLAPPPGPAGEPPTTAGAPGGRARRRARRGRRDDERAPGGDAPWPRTHRPRAAAEPRTDDREVRATARFAEQPTQPPRLRPAAGGAPAGGDPWTGTGRTHPGSGSADGADPAAALTEQDLERLMTRVLDDAARRHGIEV